MPVFVFEGEEDEALGGAGALATDDAAGDAEPTDYRRGPAKLPERRDSLGCEGPRAARPWDAGRW